MDTVQRVHDLLAEKGLSLYRLSQLSGVPLSTLTSTERRGGQLTVDTIERICAALGITMGEFFSTPASPSL